jgi:hypothetical protein
MRTPVSTRVEEVINTRIHQRFQLMGGTASKRILQRCLSKTESRRDQTLGTGPPRMRLLIQWFKFLMLTPYKSQTMMSVTRWIEYFI